MRKFALPVLVGGMMLFAMNSWAQATVVNLDLDPSGEPLYTLQGAYVTGDAHHWNHGIGGNGTFAFENLTASDGTTPTGWDVTLTLWGATGDGDATNALLGDFVYSYFAGATTGRLTLSGLTPNGAYQVYLYNSMANESMKYIMGAASDFTGGSTQTVSGRPSSTNPSDITGANPSYTAGTDYTVFNNLTADGTGKIYGRFLSLLDNGGGHLAGIQIISIPEPSSVALTIIGAVGILTGARRRRGHIPS